MLTKQLGVVANACNLADDICLVKKLEMVDFEKL